MPRNGTQRVHKGAGTRGLVELSIKSVAGFEASGIVRDCSRTINLAPSIQGMTLLTSFDGALSLPCESKAFTAKYQEPGVSAIVLVSVVAPLTGTVCEYCLEALPYITLNPARSVSGEPSTFCDGACHESFACRMTTVVIDTAFDPPPEQLSV